jgi:hypothetical protein
MIISHQHKYVFVELPLTGSTAIARELSTSYDGYPILHRHATYYDFLRIASSKEKRYFTFSCIRNPMDQAVSRYFKLKTNQYSKFTDPTELQRYQKLVRYIYLKKFDYIKNNNADFANFFLKFYKLPYNNWSCLSHNDFAFIIRFERLAADFEKVIDLLELQLKRPLPMINVTPQKRLNFLSYYTPETIERAKLVFGPFMEKWGYEFPLEWGKQSLPWWNELEFEFINIFRMIYWKYLRNRVKNWL